MSDRIAFQDAPAPPPPQPDAGPAAPPPDSLPNRPGAVPDTAGRDNMPLEAVLPTADAIRLNATRADDMIRALAAAQQAQPPQGQPPQGQPPQGQPPQGQPPQGQPPDANAELIEARRRAEQAEQDARTWRGRAEAERERQAAELRALQEQVAELSAKKARAALDDALAPGEGLTPEEMENIGPELPQAVWRYCQPLVAGMVKAAVEALRADIAASVAPVAEQVQHAQASAHSSAIKTFEDAMNAAVPGWQDQNLDPKFIAWVNAVDPMFGVPRKEALDSAAAVLDDARVARFFQAFRDQHGWQAPNGGQGAPNAPASPGPAAQQPPGGGTGRPSLADFAAPGTGRAASSAPPDAAPDAQRWTASEIAAFYAKVGKGAYRHAPAEQQRIEESIAAAMRAGTVDPAR